MIVELTGNEARFLFFSIKNKKTEVAERVRSKLLLASESAFLKSNKKGCGDGVKNSDRSQKG